MTALIPTRTKVAVTAGRAAALLSRRLGKGEGSVIGGRVTLAVDATSLDRLAAGRRTVLVSGTNGKTTTTSLLSAALATKGEVVTNQAGANMYGGMVSALSQSQAEQVVLEVDEGHLATTMSKTTPELVLLLNLSRDQLDRVGEVRMQAQKWRSAFEAQPDVTVIANADDPMVVWASETAQRTVFVSGGTTWQLDAASCPNCGSKIHWSDEGADASWQWQCSNCPLARPPVDETAVRMPTSMQLPGDVNLRNARMALTAAVMLGAEPRAAADAVSRSVGAGGRFASVTIAGMRARLVLAKNPAGWTEALRIAKNDGSPMVVAINARVQDGRDPSWLWDVPFETLKGRFLVATGERGRDLAVRLKYAEVDHTFEDDMTTALRAAAVRHSGETDVIGNYSAFQEFRKLAR